MPRTKKTDSQLRKSQRKDLFPTQRVVLHDNTNAPLPNPSDAELNWVLYNACYSGSLAKGGIAVQLSSVSPLSLGMPGTVFRIGLVRR